MTFIRVYTVYPHVSDKSIKKVGKTKEEFGDGGEVS